MTYYPDLGHETQIARGEHIRAVGWLHPDHEFPKGETTGEFRDKLREIASHWIESTVALRWAVAAGAHTCEFCGERGASGNSGVPYGDVLFVAPELICHYVEEHNYSPPVGFQKAVLECPLPGTEEYESIARSFVMKGYSGYRVRACSTDRKD